jgi:hypothetical protein
MLLACFVTVLLHTVVSNLYRSLIAFLTNAYQKSKLSNAAGFDAHRVVHCERNPSHSMRIQLLERWSRRSRLIGWFDHDESPQVPWGNTTAIAKHMNATETMKNKRSITIAIVRHAAILTELSPGVSVDPPFAGWARLALTVWRGNTSVVGSITLSSLLIKTVASTLMKTCTQSDSQLLILRHYSSNKVVTVVELTILNVNWFQLMERM